MTHTLEAGMKRLRPRDGKPRDLIEHVSQFVYRWRTELWGSGTLVASVSALVLWFFG